VSLQERYHVAHLRDPHSSGTVEPTTLATVFQAPWREVSLVQVAPGDTFGARDLVDSEAMIFITGGHGTAQLHHAPVELREGISLTLFMGERLELAADGSEPLEFFYVEMGSSG
jgi:mannose-6-phosphate isomerase-like protein (cupin superfamily)